MKSKEESKPAKTEKKQEKVKSEAKKKSKVEITKKTEVKTEEKVLKKEAAPTEKVEEQNVSKSAKFEAQQPKKSAERNAIACIIAATNNTIITVTDPTGAETLASCSGGRVVRAGREESSPFAAVMATKKVVEQLREKGVNRVDILIRGKGGASRGTPSPAAQSVIKAFLRGGIRIGRIGDVTPVPHGKMRPPCGRRGRRV